MPWAEDYSQRIEAALEWDEFVWKLDLEELLRNMRNCFGTAFFLAGLIEIDGYIKVEEFMDNFNSPLDQPNIGNIAVFRGMYRRTIQIPSEQLLPLNKPMKVASSNHKSIVHMGIVVGLEPI